MQWVVEDCLVLNSNMLSRAGMFNAGLVKAKVSWDNGSNIALLYRHSVLKLGYRLEGEPITQKVPIEKVQCHYGGVRFYFRCPACTKRRYKLQLGHTGFHCRECYRLPYFSQMCGETDGFHHRLNKAQKHLDCALRQSTWERAFANWNAVNKAFEAHILQSIDWAVLKRFGLVD